MRRQAMDVYAAGLTAAGLPPSRVERLLRELEDHYADLADVARSLPELRGWAFRYPLVALLVYPLTCLAVLPAVPVLAGVAHASQIGRWVASIALSGLVTATLLLVLQLAIFLT